MPRIETDTLNHFKVMGAAARVLDGKQRLEVLHGLFHPDGERFNFAWEWLPRKRPFRQRLYCPVLFPFWRRANVSNGREVWRGFLFADRRAGTFRPYACDFMEAENGIVVNLHIQSIDHNEAIKTIKRKITDLDRMKIEEQKKGQSAAATIWI